MFVTVSVRDYPKILKHFILIKINLFKKIYLCDFVGLQIVLRDQKSKEGFKYQSVGVY